MAEKSTHYNLDILNGNDIYNPNTVFANFEKIDTEMYNIDTNAVHSAVHILTGSVNALTRTNADFNIFKFVATAPYKANQTFTVDGQQVSAYTTNGQPLVNDCYVIGATVLCALNGSILTLFVRSNGTAENALNLNGHPDTYFAIRGDTSKTLKDVDDITTENSKTINKFPNFFTFETGDSNELTLNGSPNGKYYVIFIYARGNTNISGEQFSILYVVTSMDGLGYKSTYNQTNYIKDIILRENSITFKFYPTYTRGFIISQ